MADPHIARRRGGYRLARIAGVDIVADWSLMIIFVLIMVGLGASAFPVWHPEWSAVLTWTVAAAAAVLFLASIAVHELSHAVVANRLGVPVHQITLFIFGGIAHMSGSPKSPADELKIAAVGPLVSFAIGLAATLAGAALAWDAVTTAADPAEAASAVGPVATALLWLGPINLLLAAFNLLPGFPLDGGRVLRSVLWRVTGDIRRATRWASRGGQALAWTLMILGVAMLFGLWIPVLGGGALQGFWLILIGWFLNSAARMSYQQLVIRQALADVPVAEVMRTDFERVAPRMPLTELVERVATRAGLDSVPVTEGDNLIGVVDLDRVRGLSDEERGARTAADVMIGADRVATLRSQDPAIRALEELGHASSIPVTDDRRLVGVLRIPDLMRWLAFHSDAFPDRRPRP
jgi:Zn-dependent protease